MFLVMAIYHKIMNPVEQLTGFFCDMLTLVGTKNKK